MTTDTAKILIVDDDSAIRNLVLRFLSRKYQVESAADGKTAMAIFPKFQPDLVILDVNLPDALGYNLCEQMQSNTNVFVLMLTSRTDNVDKQQGFEQGADDYLTKPFDLQELEWRVAAILKRQRLVVPSPQQRIVFKNLIIDIERREVTVNNEIIYLTALEFDLLYFLANNPGRVLKREELIKQVWEYEYTGEQRIVDVHIGQIRRKIELDVTQPAMIQTVRGVGYKFIIPDQD
jgi:two-component system, OmpR family, response regulator